MEAGEALVLIEGATEKVKKVAQSELADERLKEDAQNIQEDLEMLESELRDITEAADETLES